MHVTVDKTFYQLPELTEINRVPAHGAWIPFADKKSALSRNPDKSCYYISLDGNWKFHLYCTPEEVPENVFSKDFRDKTWRTIPVPSNWTLQNTFDKPHYTNSAMPFESNPPRVPKANPTGIYRTSFTLPDSWNGRRTVLHVGAAESYLEVYLNGEFVGMGKDCRLPSEFDLTEGALPGRNELVCKVIRWSDSSYVEDQDQWWMAGIFRSVYLYSTQRTYIADYSFNGDYDVDAREGILDFYAELGMCLPLFRPVTPEGKTAFQSRKEAGLARTASGPDSKLDFLIDAELSSSLTGKILWKDRLKVSGSYRLSNYRGKLHVRLPGILPWSSEKPTLYNLSVMLRNPDGKILDVRAGRVGFRNIRIEGSNLLFNGKRVLIRGINRHEHNMLTGKTLSEEDMLRDIRLLKQFNFNAVRTSHYPNDRRWYDLCDEYGIYVLDEMNCESHALYPWLCRDPRWRNAFVSRAARMVLRDRSHACIYGWSLGNESGNGENHLAAIEAIMVLDQTRCIHHEGELKPTWTQSESMSSGGFDWQNNFFNPMYPTHSVLEEYSGSRTSNRPAIPCEYAHAMGNSSGALADYWDLFKKLPKLQGGFLWNWMDQGILQTDENGRRWFAYGGDFGETIHDASFNCNGMLAPDARPHPAMYEFRHCAQPVDVEPVRLKQKKFRICNRQDFMDLSVFAGKWTLALNGRILRTDKLQGLKAGPGKTEEIVLDFELPVLSGKDELFLNFEFSLARTTPWAPAGTLLAHDQVELTRICKKTKPGAPTIVTRPKIIRRARIVSVRNGESILRLSSRDGSGSFEFGRKKVLAELFDCCLFRCPTENDAIRCWRGQSYKPGVQWITAGLDRLKTQRVIVMENGPELRVEKILTGTDPKAEIEFIQTIRPEPDGFFSFHQHYSIPETFPTLPRIGVRAVLPNEFEEVDYFGRGPWENYSDRCRAAEIGLYHSSVSKMYEDSYVVPQENGNRTGVRFVTLSSDDAVIRVESDTPFEFGASHADAPDLFQAKHQNEVPFHPKTFWHIDLAQRGLGTGACGPQTLEKYALDRKSYDFSFRLIVNRRTSLSRMANHSTY